MLVLFPNWNILGYVPYRHAFFMCYFYPDREIGVNVDLFLLGRSNVDFVWFSIMLSFFPTECDRLYIPCRSCGRVKLPHYYCCSGDKENNNTTNWWNKHNIGQKENSSTKSPFRCWCFMPKKILFRSYLVAGTHRVRFWKWSFYEYFQEPKL